MAGGYLLAEQVGLAEGFKALHPAAREAEVFAGLYTMRDVLGFNQ